MQGVHIIPIKMPGGIQQNFLQSTSFLEVKQTQVIRVGAYLWQNIIGMGEAVSDGDSFQPCQEAALLFGLDYLFGDGWGVLACVALPEDD